VAVGTPEHERYLAAILAELDARADDYRGDLVSIYLGGGTPSLWDPACVGEAIAAIERRFSGRAQEITLEANPIDCEPDRLAAWRQAGVNRLSIGVQSTVAQELVVLGRDHRFGDGRAAVERALAAGFTVSADFILGTPTGDPGRIPDVFGEVDHLSVYELTIEERTAFGQRARDGRLVPRSEDELEALYVATHEALARKGFEHYEISSYAKPGKRAVHNSLYWRGAPFLGLGVGAASLAVHADGSGERRTNPRKVADYLGGVAAEVTAIAPAEMAADRAWLGMRTADGVAEAELPTDVVEWALAEGLAERRDGPRWSGPGSARSAGWICPTLRGFLMADRIAARIVQAL
jgi:oxygen-independent coproporphyrinogen III oxidase